MGITYCRLEVVEDTSSYLNIPAIEITEHIGRNHMEMCRFTGLNDVEYRKVASALRRMTSSIFKQPRREKKRALDDEQRRFLLESLRFNQIDARQMTIKKAHAKTCKWLLERPEYLDWLNPIISSEHHGFLWIRGKPGTGKSTLMKFCLANARKTMKDAIVISFFFNARGEGLEKSTLGTYQSLLLQLLEQLPALEFVFDFLHLSIRGNIANYQWSMESLKTLLEQAILSLGDSSLVCLIDALDECDENQIRDMISFFEYVGELAVSASIRFQVLFSSRHYPHITIRRGIILILEGQEGHTQDLINYIESELKIGHSKVAEQTRIDLQDKAAGVFLWVVLVVEILNKEYDSGRIHALRRRLRDLPGDLHELFRDILTRDSNHRDELVLCVQWILFARQPLNPEQLYFAIRSGVEPENLSKWDPEVISIPDIRRYILDGSKGLAEITTSKTPKVQFIHESVRDFLLRENGLGRIWPDLGSNLQGQSQERLKQCCMSYIQFYMDYRDTRVVGKDLPRALWHEAKALRESVTCEFPFLEYAVRHVLYHADSAEEWSISQRSFIQSFQLSDWLWLDNLFERHQVRRHTPRATLLYILAENNMSNLLKIHPSVLSFLELEDERYKFPLLASLATGSESAVRTFLAALAASQPPGSELQGLCNQYCGEGGTKVRVGRDLDVSKHKTALSCMVEICDGTLFAIVFAAHKVDPDSKTKHGRTLLSQAAVNGHEAIVKLLLKTGEVDINAKDKNRQTPLWQAVSKKNEAIVKLLLNTGKVDVNSKNSGGPTALFEAAANGHEVIVKLLLGTSKVDVNWKNNIKQTPLGEAASNGHEAIVELLLKTGKVDVDSKDISGRTPLWQAAASDHEAIVKLLLKTNKVDVDSKDDNDQTPLSQAAFRGYEAVIKLLLGTGKVDINSKDKYDRTPLSYAASQGNQVKIKLLLETGKVNFNWQVRTPLSHATYEKKEAVVKLLLETSKSDIDIDSKDEDGCTPLSYAAVWGSESVVKLLLETGKADVNSKDKFGETPLSRAVTRGHKNIVHLLENYVRPEAPVSS